MTAAKAIGAFDAALLVLFLLLAITDAYRLPGFLGQHNQPQQAGWPWPVYDQNGRDRARPQPLDWDVYFPTDLQVGAGLQAGHDD